ncbi:tumor necrosis factor receptor superfamily member 1A-like isoform X1 [Chiroxiphia lanceolata]|uniref:tumor necrosis factor receptor superfamily member 1A-like isoform X1 n=2 Tax=Chiroxiphia lanceolata TaxID=296741 RepID=UPI0013CE60AA|nr:tumor necrosis factor receptor superfamily member 1A-like isoform X1 [Chiroxiphia lanceolata]
MAAGGAAGLLLVMLLTMPGTRAKNCEEGEYFHEGHCCVSCPAGTFAAEHCSAPHLRGKCHPCKEGESYTAHENGLDECLSCRQCKDDQVTVRPCTLTHNTECECKQGYFCTDKSCEICQRHNKMYPEGKEIDQNCNATTGLGCDLPGQGSTALSWVILPIILVVVMVLLFLVFKKLKCHKAASADKDVEKSLKSEGGSESLILPERKTPASANNSVNPEDENCGESPESQAQISINLEVEDTSPEEDSALTEQGTILHGDWKHRVLRWLRRIPESSLQSKPGQNSAFHQNNLSNVSSIRTPANHVVREQEHRIIVKDLSQKERRVCFEAFIKEVPPKNWRQLMRTHLHDNDIDKIIYNFHNDIEEQSYQMLLIWRNTLGEKQCIIKLLSELKHIDRKAYDNVVNTLKSNNIISKAEATDKCL